ncbi:putative ribonuclease H-like domain-containing protein, partial [Tanacetum coccineum]
PNFPNRVYKVEKALYGLHQAPRAWYETLSTYLLDNEFERGKINKTLFIRRHNGDILLVQKFEFIEVKTASTPMETQKPLLKDEDGEEVDVHLYRSMIGSLMYLTSSRPDMMYIKGQPKLGLLYPKDSPFDLVAYTDSDYAGASLDRKSTTGGCQFLGSRLISWQCKKQIVVANSITEAEYVAASSCCGQVLWIQNQLLDYGDCNEKKLIQMVKIHTDKNVADLLTKAFDPSGPTTNVVDKTVNEEMDDSLVRAATTTFSLEVEQDSGNIYKTQSKATPNEPSSLGTSSGGGPKRQETMGDTIAQTRSENVSKLSNDPLLAGVNTPRSDEDSMKLKELMEFCTKLQQRVLDLENTKTAQAQKITSLKLRVKKLEKKGGSRTHKLKILYKVGKSARVISSDEASLGDQEDASKQGRKIDDIDKDVEITLVDETQRRYDDDLITVDPVTTAGEVVTTAGVEISTAKPTETIIIDDLTLAQTLIETRSKAIIEEPKKPTKRKDQIRHDEEVAQMQAELEEEDRLVRQREEEANIVSWDNVQAMIDDDYQMAQQMQAEEQEKLSIKEKSKLFVKLLEARKKHFAAIRAQEKRNKPPTKAQKRKIMSTYLKNMAGYKHNQLKNKSFDDIQKLFDKAMKRLEQESSKKQKLEEDKESEELKKCLEIVPDDGDDVTIDATPLAVKSPSIVDWKIHKEGKKSYYQIIRADGSSKMYLVFSHMLKIFDREDLETLYKLVKAKYGSTRPGEDMDLVLYGDLKTMFKPHVEDNVWKNQSDYRVLDWNLYDSCGLHSLRKQNVHIHMLVEKRYPLTTPTITDMLNRKLQADHWNEMCYQLLKLITKQLKNQ